MVYLVGAGLGDAELITSKGLECIKKADTIIYDHLVNPTLLNHAKDGCELIYAGKVAGNHHLNQDEINKTIIKYSKIGTVVRLKGGDPFIFGRGGEEVLALAENGIPYELVSGVSSCYGAAEYCGIPVTHRGIATSFHVITGHEKKDSETVDYAALSKLTGTLVFLMGLSCVTNICQKLIEHGKPPETPAAIICSGSTEKQAFVSGTLKNLPALAETMSSPAIILIGDVVNLQRDWFFPSGKKILATGTPFTNSNIKKSAVNMPVTEISLIKTVPISFNLFTETDLRNYTHIVFTSSVGVNIFFDFMKQAKKDIRILGDTKFAVVGAKTAQKLEEYGIFAEIIPQKHSSLELAKILLNHCSKIDNILIVRAENGTDTIAKALNKSKIPFTDLTLYRTETDFSKSELLNLCIGEMDYVIFSSGSAAKAYGEMINTKTQAKIISIGEQTTKTAQKYGLTVYKTARHADADGIIECIKEGH